MTNRYEDCRSRYAQEVWKRCTNVPEAIRENPQAKTTTGAFLAAWLPHIPSFRSPKEKPSAKSGCYDFWGIRVCSQCQNVAIFENDGRGKTKLDCCGRRHRIPPKSVDKVPKDKMIKSWVKCHPMGHVELTYNQACCLKTTDMGANFGQTTLFSPELEADDEFPAEFMGCLVQAHLSPLKVMLAERNTGAAWCVYTKEKVWQWDAKDEDEFVYLVREIPQTGLNPRILTTRSEHAPVQHGGSDSDVWSLDSVDMAKTLGPLLSEQANRSNDRPVPCYQNIVDPNLFVRPRNSDGKHVWVPSEYDISPTGYEVRLVGANRAHWMDTKLIEAVSVPVLRKALPLLARLRRPHLLLEGQRIQVVVKAQRIELPPSPASGSDYVGLWHVEGENEPVVAVILYYYDVDPDLEGGCVEFIERRPLHVIDSGYDTFEDSGKEAMRKALRPRDGGEPRIACCTVPVQTGTLLVFSNYQMAHRVLRMVNHRTDRSAARNFVALFVMDPASRPLLPARCHLAEAYLYERALTGTPSSSKNSSPDRQESKKFKPEELHLNGSVATLIMEFMGVVPSLEEKKRLRKKLMLSQLQPKGKIGAHGSNLYSIGNGSFAMLGWLQTMLEDEDDLWLGHESFDAAIKRVRAFNKPAPVGRGLSYTLSVPTDDLDNPSEHSDED